MISSPTSTLIISHTSTPISSPTSTHINSPTSTPISSPTSTPINSPTSTSISSPTSTPISSPTCTSTPISSPTSTPINSHTSAPISSSTSDQNSYIVASVIVVIAVAVVAAIVIVILIRIGILQKKTPTQPTTDGLDNVTYNGSLTNISRATVDPMTDLIPHATYESLKEKEEASSQVNNDYLEEDCNPYIIPASHEEELYVQLESKKMKKIPRHQIEATAMLGSGQFGGVQIGIWNGSIGRCEVAIKTLNPTITQPDAKVKFLQEAAIMAQFRHPNVIQLYGIVLDGEPIMLLLELATKKDLRTHLSTMKPE
ncbi:hypothetical protein EMCRGX_G016646 [Ephydatia muelleri]